MVYMAFNGAKRSLMSGTLGIFDLRSFGLKKNYHITEEASLLRCVLARHCLHVRILLLKLPWRFVTFQLWLLNKYAASYRVHVHKGRSVGHRRKWTIKESVENMDRDLGDILRNRCHLGIAVATICVLLPSAKRWEYATAAGTFSGRMIE